MNFSLQYKTASEKRPRREQRTISMLQGKDKSDESLMTEDQDDVAGGCLGQEVKIEGMGNVLCDKEFVRRPPHLQHKFCDACRVGFAVSGKSIRTLPDSLKATFSNTTRAGFWAIHKQGDEIYEFRVINQHSKRCPGGPLILFHGPAPREPKVGIPWPPLPEGLVRESGEVWLRVVYGTLSPIYPWEPAERTIIARTAQSNITTTRGATNKRSLSPADDKARATRHQAAATAFCSSCSPGGSNQSTATAFTFSGASMPMAMGAVTQVSWDVPSAALNYVDAHSTGSGHGPLHPLSSVLQAVYSVTAEALRGSASLSDTQQSAHVSTLRHALQMNATLHRQLLHWLRAVPDEPNFETTSILGRGGERDAELALGHLEALVMPDEASPWPSSNEGGDTSCGSHLSDSRLETFLSDLLASESPAASSADPPAVASSSNLGSSGARMLLGRHEDSDERPQDEVNGQRPFHGMPSAPPSPPCTPVASLASDWRMNALTLSFQNAAFEKAYRMEALSGAAINAYGVAGILVLQISYLVQQLDDTDPCARPWKWIVPCILSLVSSITHSLIGRIGRPQLERQALMWMNVTNTICGCVAINRLAMNDQIERLRSGECLVAETGLPPPTFTPQEACFGLFGFFLRTVQQHYLSLDFWLGQLEIWFFLGAAAATPNLATVSRWHVVAYCFFTILLGDIFGRCLQRSLRQRYATKQAEAKALWVSLARTQSSASRLECGFSS